MDDDGEVESVGYNSAQPSPRGRAGEETLSTPLCRCSTHTERRRGWVYVDVDSMPTSIIAHHSSPSSLTTLHSPPSSLTTLLHPSPSPLSSILPHHSPPSISLTTHLHPPSPLTSIISSTTIGYPTTKNQTPTTATATATN